MLVVVHLRAAFLIRVLLLAGLGWLGAFTAAGWPAAAQTLDPAVVTVSDFAGVQLDGTARSTTATMSSFSITASAGTGWHVTIQATQFAEVNDVGAYVAGGKTLPVGSLTMPVPSVQPSDGRVTVAPGPYTLDGAAVQIASASTDADGTYGFSHTGPLTLSVPASTFARTYRSDVTVDVQSGP